MYLVKQRIKFNKIFNYKYWYKKKILVNLRLTRKQFKIYLFLDFF